MNIFQQKRRGVCGTVLICAVVLAGLLRTGAGAAPEDARVDYHRLCPLHQEKAPPGPHDWLAQHDEPGQTVEEFLRQRTWKPDSARTTIYLMLIGEFDPVRLQIILKTAEYMQAFFGLPVVFHDPVPLSAIPDRARRIHPLTGDRQILSTYVLDHLLKKDKPADAVCLIAFTTVDLWPGTGWNFVFGQASPYDGVAVQSVYRDGDPNEGPDAYLLALRRAFRTAVHEAAHVFGLYHCVGHECVMNGSNHRRESDSRPLWLCPLCLEKICTGLDLDPVERYRRLAEVAERFGLLEEAEFFRGSIDLLERE